MSDDFMNSLIEQRRKREENKTSDSPLSDFSDLDMLFGSKGSSKAEDNNIAQQTSIPEIKKVTPAIGLDLKQNNLQQGQITSLSVQQMRAMPAQPQDRPKTLSTMQTGQMTSSSVQQARAIPIQPQETEDDAGTARTDDLSKYATNESYNSSPTGQTENVATNAGTARANFTCSA